MKNSFYNTVKERRNQPTDLEKIKECIHKEHPKLNNKKTIFYFLKWYRNWIDKSPKNIQRGEIINGKDTQHH